MPKQQQKEDILARLKDGAENTRAQKGFRVLLGGMEDMELPSHIFFS